MLKVVNVLLAAILVGTLAANALLERTDSSVPRRDYLPEMMYPVAAESFGTGSAFRDGRALQAPPLGTIARGAKRLRYTPSAEDAVRAGREIAAPRVADPAASREADRAAKVYSTYCVPCHGAGGLGDGPVVARGYPPPPSLLAERAVSMKDGQMFHVLTFGQRNMPPYAAQIDEGDRWRAIAYVRQLQRSAK
jgi:mono/diheme cytochrome c family protein